MKRICFVLIGFIFSFPVIGQDLNSYQYVVVPNKFEFTKEANMYQVNSLTEFLFLKYGFEAYMEGDNFSEEIKEAGCKVLYADVEENSGLFVTRLNVILKDCNNNKIFVSEEGTSRSKDYKEAYHEALRQAFKSIEKLNYTYRPGDVRETEEEPRENTTNPFPEKKTVIVTAIPKTPLDSVHKKETSELVINSEDLEFTRDEIIYNLKKSGKGFDLYQKGMSKPFASLIPSQTNGSFIYSSVSDQGIASFRDNGDLVIEIFQRETNSTETRIFNLHN